MLNNKTKFQFKKRTYHGTSLLNLPFLFFFCPEGGPSDNVLRLSPIPCRSWLVGLGAITWSGSMLSLVDFCWVKWSDVTLRLVDLGRVTWSDSIDTSLCWGWYGGSSDTTEESLEMALSLNDALRRLLKLSLWQQEVNDTKIEMAD